MADADIHLEKIRGRGGGAGFRGSQIYRAGKQPRTLGDDLTEKKFCAGISAGYLSSTSGVVTTKENTF